MAEQERAVVPIDLTVYSDALVFLGTAGIVIPIVRRLGISSVLGYLAAGALLGPLGLGALKGRFHALYWLTVTDPKNVEAIAELGVVFLLFLIGLELSFERLKTMRRFILGLGSLQVILSTALIAAAAIAAGADSRAALIVGACLSLSSTAIVLETLAEQERLSTRAGRASFAVLLAQDIAVVPLLFLISALGRSGSLWVGLGAAILQAAIALGIIVVLGRFLMRPLFRLVAKANSSDLFVAAVLFVIVGAGVLASLAGLSMALGAFVAGLLLAETEFGKAIQATVEPFKGLLLGAFFFTVGMTVDFYAVVRQPALLLAGIIGLVVVKGTVLALLSRAFRLPWLTAVEMGLALGPGGEFAFVGIGLAGSLGLLGQADAGFVLALTAISMALIPILARVGEQLRKTLVPVRTEPSLNVLPSPVEHRAIVVGYGRVGRVVCELLKRHGIAFLAVDRNPDTVKEARRSEPDVYYGDATDADFLKACGIERAAGVILTVNVADVLDDIVDTVRALRPDVAIVARARDAEHARRLYHEGVSDAVPETIEASLQLSEAALVALGIAMGPAIASIHERRDAFRRELQAAARDAGVNSESKLRRTLRPAGGSR